jgi:hypothetical protein
VKTFVRTGVTPATTITIIGMRFQVKPMPPIARAVDFQFTERPAASLQNSR